MYIPSDAKNISVLISGGIDSTLLLYLLSKEIVDNNLDVQLNAISFRKGAINLENIKKIVQYIEQKNSIKILYSKSANSGWIREVVSEVFEVYQSDYVYTGCNMVITDVFTPTKYIRDDTPPVRGNPLNERHLRPFINQSKIHIVELYLTHNIIDLLKMTYSCGFLENEECGECYFCMEKIWATKKLGINQLFNYTNNTYNYELFNGEL